ncbi:unnamed protein product (mitochondrion) [Plasmodiophora brassicae]|uniref:Brix domain-containing protein n=1 Tax=Plasmodiophora brassicae TaxID=37360 RepID=A0A3P3YDH3_PLABS|nr:unnamed protein product [Plasmodiophora brassicae]
MRRGVVAPPIVDLIGNLRVVMEPFTARRLQERSKTRLRDILSVCGPLGVTHIVALSQTDLGTNQYTLLADVARMSRRPVTSLQNHLQHPPLVVLNNFSPNGDHVRPIMAAMFQNMFPTVNVATIKLSDCRRVVLFSLDAEKDVIHFRHYLVNASPSGLTRTVKKVIRARIPDLHNFNDISDYVLNGNASESEVDAEDSRVILPQDFSGRGNRKSQQSAIRLQEIGPRMTMQLLKIEEGLCSGPVIYNRFVNKTPEEIAEMRRAYAEKQATKAARRAAQEANVKRKAAKVAEAKAKKKQRQEAHSDSQGTDDEEWYRREVGADLDAM